MLEPLKISLERADRGPDQLTGGPRRTWTKAGRNLRRRDGMNIPLRRGKTGFQLTQRVRITWEEPTNWTGTKNPR